MGIAALATLGATYADAPLIVPETAMVRLLGLVLWCVVIWSVLHVFATSQRSLAALAIGAIVLLAHAQIDLTASWAQSCGLLIACIAVGVGMGRKHDENAPRTHAAIPPLAALVPLGLAIIVGLAARHALAWERTLLTAASHVTPIADFSLRWTELSSATPPANDSRERYFADLSALLGRPASPRLISIAAPSRAP
jgi:hypothetical protein